MLGTIAIETVGAEDVDDRPIAVRRKRRSSSGLVDPSGHAQHHKSEAINDVAEVPSDVIKTPTKPKKRVRFSDPGPERQDPQSTGLTPALKRSNLIANIQTSAVSGPRWLAQGPRKRQSLPVLRSNALPSPSLSPPPTPYLSGEVQFETLRQVLDPRSRRRLRRNNLSDEINAIDTEKKMNSQWKQEIQELKDELALAKQPICKTGDAAKDQIGFNDRIEGLEEELSTLRRQLRAKSIPNEQPSNPLDSSRSPPDSSTFSDGDANDDDFVMINFHDNGALRDTDVDEAPRARAEDTKEGLPLVSMDADAFRSARLALEYLDPGETSLGLTTEDPASILEAILDRLRSLKAKTILAETSLSASKTHEANLRSQFNAVLQQLDRSRAYGEGLSEQLTFEKTKGDAIEKHAQNLGFSIEAESGRVQGLEAELDEKQRSIKKLQEALDTYRNEVVRLEALINKLDGEHQNRVVDIQTKMNETVEDLECHVAAETTGRQAAEKETVVRGERIKQLEQKGSELKDAMNEKQNIIRDMEREMAQEKESREKEVGVMNVRVGELSSSLEEAVSDLAKLEQENRRLIERLEEEKAAGKRSMEAIQTKTTQWMKDVETIRENHERDMQRRGSEVVEHRGLLTPVSACKFKDVEGYVEVRRGKVRKRPDSGVGILEELEDDELMTENF